MQLAFFFDRTRCIGCYTFVMVCKDWQDVQQGAWYDPDNEAVDRGGCCNVLTDDGRSLGGAYCSNTSLVQVEKA